MSANDSSGHNGPVMIGLLVVLFPFVLLAFVLFMERVEEPLTRAASERDLEHFLEDATPGELETFVREGSDSALGGAARRLGLRRDRTS